MDRRVYALADQLLLIERELAALGEFDRLIGGPS